LKTAPIDLEVGAYGQWYSEQGQDGFASPSDNSHCIQWHSSYRPQVSVMLVKYLKVLFSINGTELLLPMEIQG